MLTPEEKQIVDTSWPPEMVSLNETQRRFVYAAVEAVLDAREQDQFPTLQDYERAFDAAMNDSRMLGNFKGGWNCCVEWFRKRVVPVPASAPDDHLRQKWCIRIREWIERQYGITASLREADELVVLLLGAPVPASAPQDEDGPSAMTPAHKEALEELAAQQRRDAQWEKALLEVGERESATLLSKKIIYEVRWRLASAPAVSGKAGGSGSE